MTNQAYHSFLTLNQAVVQCKKCPRLVDHREGVPKRASYKEESYWRKPVPGFGDPNAQIILLGLAPSAHGGNRTGRIFTGDESGRFLMHCLYKSGLANQSSSEYRNDGLKLKNCYMTAAVKCVPPKNKPLKKECLNCQPYWESEVHLLKNAKAIVALGRLAFQSFIDFAKAEGFDTKGMEFEHEGKFFFKNFFTLYACYHPSPQNTYTGKLTESMMVKLFNKIKRDVS
ncbi:MAG: uracil-DNA glycosylase [Simkaniaceae bacterium]